MYRQRVHFFPKSWGATMDLLSLGEEYNKLAAGKGWVEGTFWFPTVGENEIIVEWDYPDLATFQRETEGMMTEPDMLALAQKISDVDASRSPYSELVNTAPSFA